MWLFYALWPVVLFGGPIVALYLLVGDVTTELILFLLGLVLLVAVPVSVLVSILRK